MAAKRLGLVTAGEPKIDPPVVAPNPKLPAVVVAVAGKAAAEAAPNPKPVPDVPVEAVGRPNENPVAGVVVAVVADPKAPKVNPLVEVVVVGGAAEPNVKGPEVATGFNAEKKLLAVVVVVVGGCKALPVAKGRPVVAVTPLGLASDTVVVKGGGPYGVATLVLSESKRNLSKGDMELLVLGESKKAVFTSGFRRWRRSCVFERLNSSFNVYS